MDAQKALEVLVFLLNRAPINLAEQAAANHAIEVIRASLQPAKTDSQ